MKQTMKNCIDLAKEVADAVNYEGEIPNAMYLDEQSKVMATFVDSAFSFQYGTLCKVSVILHIGQIERIVNISFTDDYTNPTDFDALYEEARQWWEQFKTSGHEILIDTQIKNTLRK